MNSDKYSSSFINNASRLDALLMNEGIFAKSSLMVVEGDDKQSVIDICNELSALTRGLYTEQIKQLALAYKNDLIMLMGHRTLQSICNSTKAEFYETNEVSYERLISELNGLIGLSNVKQTVNDLISYHKIQNLRKSIGLSVPKGTMHMAFLGNPGTGKTTVARIVGRLYQHIGLLSKGHFVEVSRTDLIAGYQGQTALKVKEVIEKSKGGVLFIDEAYSITENEHSDSYGRECLTELTKALEDYRQDLVVIVSGYKEPMEKFFDSNPGLRSRFNTFIDFPDYSISELMLILDKIAKENDYCFTLDANAKIEALISEQVSSFKLNFPNARLVRNLFERSIMNQARRLNCQQNTPSKEQLRTVTEADVFS